MNILSLLSEHFASAPLRHLLNRSRSDAKPQHPPSRLIRLKDPTLFKLALLHFCICTWHSFFTHLTSCMHALSFCTHDHLICTRFHYSFIRPCLPKCNSPRDLSSPCILSRGRVGLSQKARCLCTYFLLVLAKALRLFVIAVELKCRIAYRRVRVLA